MNSYNKYTDLQINELVATRLKKKCLLTEESVLAYMDSGYRTFDPCNNPTDAMPIIIENKIGMNFIGNIVGWSASHICESKGELEVYDKNYYRAAMTCFLIMKDAENEG
ncbi:phage protein NinX family protein [Proteus columbae]|uniref:phage protein NinX family protein n=1 Tax=Proteus columbae TaxID=1987580 RepID=UPI00288AE3CC|nr:phage protein NinX family protein [Proteus columbae]